MKKVKIFPIGIHDGETPAEVEGSVNRFLKKLHEEGYYTELHFTSSYVAVVYWRVEKGEVLICSDEAESLLTT